MNEVPPSPGQHSYLRTGTTKPGAIRRGGEDGVTVRAGAAAALASEASAASTTAKPATETWTYLIAGATAGMVSATATAPLDVLRTRLQSDYYQSQLTASRLARGIPSPSSLPILRASLLHVQETFQILIAVPRVEGWQALFRGLVPNLAGVVPARAVYFYTYTNTKKALSSWQRKTEESFAIQAPAAICAGLATGTVTNPIWVIKTRLQLDKANAEMPGSANITGRRYNGVVDCVLKTVRHEGIRGLYRGLSASFLGISESATQMVLYERGKKYLRRREARIEASGQQVTFWDNVVSSSGNTVIAGASKLVATLITYPHEVLRTRLRQAPLENGRLKYSGLLQCFTMVWKQEGFVALYGGMVPHLFRTVPSAAIMFGTYEAVVRLLGGTTEI